MLRIIEGIFHKTNIRNIISTKSDKRFKNLFDDDLLFKNPLKFPIKENINIIVEKIMKVNKIGEISFINKPEILLNSFFVSALLNIEWKKTCI